MRLHCSDGSNATCDNIIHNVWYNVFVPKIAVFYECNKDERMKVFSWTAFEFLSLVRQRAKRTDDYVNGLKWQHHESTARLRCCKNWSSFYYFKGDPTSSGVKEPREGSPISFSLLHSLQTVIFAGFKIWNLILQADTSAFSKSTAQAFVIYRP